MEHDESYEATGEEALRIEEEKAEKNDTQSIAVAITGKGGDRITLIATGFDRTRQKRSVMLRLPLDKVRKLVRALGEAMATAGGMQDEPT